MAASSKLLRGVSIMEAASMEFHVATLLMIFIALSYLMSRAWVR
jgi:hypothetical protein